MSSKRFETYFASECIQWTQPNCSDLQYCLVFSDIYECNQPCVGVHLQSNSSYVLLIECYLSSECCQNNLCRSPRCIALLVFRV